MKRLYRDRWDKKVAGICGGLGQLLRIDPNIIRLLLIMVTTLTLVLPILTLYLITWLLIPLGPSTYIELKCTKLYRSVKNQKVSGICGGIAKMLYIDPTIVRLIVLFALVLTAIFPILITYIIGTFIIPENPDESTQ